MLSVLLPVRNGAETLDVALESLHNQTRQPDRVLVVDDGSQDSTPRLLERWSRRWPAVDVVRSPGLGLARALNLGLLRLEGSTWIARMDADDRCDARRFERQLALAAGRPELALLGCEVRHALSPGLDPELYLGMRRHIDWANAFHDHDELERALWIDSPLPHPGWLVHARAFARAGLYDESSDVPEDYEWLHRFFAAARADGSLRAAKVSTGPLLDWCESATRLTRTASAYSEAAFNRVKARALRARIDGACPELFVFGLGPKAKALFPYLREEVGPRLRAIVEVNPRKIGTTYNDVPVCSVEQWRARGTGRGAFVLICLGEPERREAAEALCLESGLDRAQFLAL